ncbi:hypothetical protein POM88_020764 [Heracleum sosnowskyi]|uniref:Uncharacterized protein n=1 Tax=Heracleum sosnowskyi TaxID=360622 RepID=A0AAD8MS97_9APIA|nr:hypothetical protein POM88_020764 [Heracleum sosnowskyi]
MWPRFIHAIRTKRVLQVDVVDGNIIPGHSGVMYEESSIEKTTTSFSLKYNLSATFSHLPRPIHIAFFITTLVRFITTLVRFNLSLTLLFLRFGPAHVPISSMELDKEYSNTKEVVGEENRGVVRIKLVIRKQDLEEMLREGGTIEDMIVQLQNNQLVDTFKNLDTNASKNSTGWKPVFPSIPEDC